MLNRILNGQFIIKAGNDESCKHTDKLGRVKSKILHRGKFDITTIEGNKILQFKSYVVI